MVETVLNYLEGTNCYLTVSEVAKILRKHPETVYRHIRKDKLPSIKDGRRRKIPPSGLADWIRQWTTRKSSSPRTSTELKPRAAKSVGWPYMEFKTGRDRHQAVNAF